MSSRSTYPTWRTARTSSTGGWSPADSHPVHAAFTFQVGPGLQPQRPGLLDQIISSSHTGTAASTGLTVSRSLVTAAIAIVFGGLLVVWCWGSCRSDGASAPSSASLRQIGAIAGLLAMPLEVGYTAGRSLGVITDGSAWRAVFDTTIGVAWVVRAAVDRR